MIEQLMFALSATDTNMVKDMKEMSAFVYNGGKNAFADENEERK